MALPGYLEDTGKDLAKQMTATYSVPIDTSKFAQQVAPQDAMQQSAIGMAQAGVGSYSPYLQQDKEEILLRRPWTDEEEEVTYFRLKDFESYLKKNKFFEYKSHRIAQRLRDINGNSVVLKIKGRAVRVWKIPAFDSTDVDLKTPSFSQGEAPF